MVLLRFLLSGRALCLPLVAGAAALSCSPEEAYLGVVPGDDEDTTDEVVPYSCDELCFRDPHLTEDEVRALYDETTFEAPPTETPAPSWVYPLAKSVHPSSLGLLSVHFLRSRPEQEIFELTVDAGERTRRLYFPCFSATNEGCTYQLPESFWLNASNEFAGEEITLRLRGASSGALSEYAEIEAELSPDPVSGGLYYWSSELRGMYRLLFGGRQAVPYVAPGTDANPDACAGCHAVSRDGKTIAYTVGSADPDGDVFDNAAFAGSLTVAPTTALDEPQIDPEGAEPVGAGMLALSDDGSRVVAAFDYLLELRDATTGALLDQTDALDGMIPYFPEFNPDSDAIVVTLTNQVDSEIAVRSGGLYVVSVENDSFGAVTELVPEDPAESHYYPSWSPDGEWVAFVSSPAGQKSYDQAQSKLRLVSVETGEVFDLKNAAGPPGSTSTWPKFAPFHQCPEGGSECPDQEHIFFLSYSSKRPYGLVANQPGDYLRSQLWMSALIMERAAEGEDPSSVPFWVPYQAPDTSNHLGYWTRSVACIDSSDCGLGQECTDGSCILVPR